MDKNAGADGDYLISSLYFDDIYDTSLYEKNYGVFKRQKYRIRAYNRSSSVIKLEIKSKYGQFISKKSASITLDEYYKILNNDYEFLRDSDNSVKTDYYHQISGNFLKPKVIVDYDREAYILNAGNVRITFDKDLRVGFNSMDLFDPNLIDLAIFSPDILILEVKFDEFLPDYIRGIFRMLRHESSAISKYVYCREKVMIKNL
jgi:hypothetical protein